LERNGQDQPVNDKMSCHPQPRCGLGSAERNFCEREVQRHETTEGGPDAIELE